MWSADALANLLQCVPIIVFREFSVKHQFNLLPSGLNLIVFLLCEGIMDTNVNNIFEMVF